MKNFLKSLFNKRPAMTPLQKGQLAPLFTALDQDGKTVQLSDYAGNKVVLFFYPADDTPTCTTEACNLRDYQTTLHEAGYQIIGVSPDSVEKHRKFAAKFSLPYPLLADPELIILKAYHVWGWKKFMGRAYDGVHRTTFLINEKGIIEQVIAQVKSKEHAQQILEFG